jgi:uncharacterized membrane protein YqiK
MAVEVSRREKEIGIIQKEKERELEHAKQLAAVAEKERAHQNVITVEKTAEAEREKQVLVIQQRASSEKKQIEKQIAADAEYYKVLRNAESEQKGAEMRASAIERLAHAKLAEMTAVAEGERKLIEAKNTIDRMVLFKEGLVEISHILPDVVREAMKPAEKISDIRVLHVGGMGAEGGQGYAANSVVNAFLQAGAAYPMFREMLKFADIDTKKGLVDVLRRAAKQIPALKDILDKIPEDMKEAPASVEAKAVEAKGGRKA